MPWPVDAQRVPLAAIVAVLWNVHAKDRVLAVGDKDEAGAAQAILLECGLGQAPQPAHLAAVRQFFKCLHPGSRSRIYSA